LALHFYNLGNQDYIADFDEWKKENPDAYQFGKKAFSEKQLRGYRNFKYNVNQWFLKNGEAPVIYDKKKAQQTLTNLEAHYFNKGYYKAEASLEAEKKDNKRVSLTYFIDTDSVTTISDYSTLIEAKVLDSIYNIKKHKSIVKEGLPMDYEYFEEEQDRITTNYRNSGIYRFNKNAITFEADTANYKADIKLIINDSISDVPYKIQHISKINIFTDYSYNLRDEEITDSLSYKGYNFKAYDELRYNPELFLNSVFIEPNAIYKDTDRELTRKHLRGLKNFRSVEIRYRELENDSLEASIYLNPMKKYSIAVSTELTHSNIRQLGISGKISFLNRNVFKGAEILRFSIQGSFLDSKDAADNQKLLNAWEVGGDVSLELPRFFTPFNTDIVVAKEYSPKTTFTLAAGLQKNIGLDKQKYTGIIDYTWESSETTNHSFELFNLQFIKNLNTDSYFNIYRSEFSTIQNIAETYFNQTLTNKTVIPFINTEVDDDFRASNPEEYKIAQNIKNRYKIITENVLVPAVTYTYTYNSSENYKDTDFSFFRGRFVTSGNLTSALSNQKNEDNQKTLFNTPIAQYFRTDLEYKNFWSLANENVLAFRTFLGIAIPYGNSNSIPFSRSYFIGGPNDLRAWRIYDLGPGASKTGLEYNVGSLKLLTSLEYRFNILNSIKGALFVDAGNIWDITNTDATLPKAKFEGLNSIKDIAIGTGFGLRYDLNFILLRLDLGFKTYEPYNSKGEKWFKNMNFGNAVYNFGISYPF
ncbi:MAG TPA: BamA/TamA family outer membrane protein, partial [Flavobacteriaceae bacterium]|nr:BamA/TamA family outer membrane protein [Flavobacteriaceae bacterium]